MLGGALSPNVHFSCTQAGFGHKKTPPPSRGGWGRKVSHQGRYSGQELASHDEALHLIGALVDLRDLLSWLVGHVFGGFSGLWSVRGGTQGQVSIVRACTFCAPDILTMWGWSYPW